MTKSSHRRHPESRIPSFTNEASNEMATIRCDIVSAEEEIFHGEATMVVATGEEGELGIAPRHAALITRLKPGQVRVLQENGEELFFYVSGGILEVQPSVVTVLAD